ncbi:MAG: aldehyde dehydrogenase family protein [Treponema sp.]|nr:aldehyde dehydrogenase family protein [Treponema sp.]
MTAVIARARTAQALWAAVPYRERARRMRKAGARLFDRLDEIIAAIHDDNGKLPIDALAAELLPAFMALRYYIRRGRRFMKSRSLGMGSLLMFNKKSRMIYRPWGVVGIISPWNFPFAIPFSEIVMALLAGNAVLFKTAAITGKVGGALAALFSDAGLPPGLFNHIVMSGKEAGPAFIGTPEAPGVDKLFFTGSTATGRELMALAASRLLPLVLELGGADAAIIRADADLDRAAAGIVWAGFSNCGQACGGVQRVIVDRAVYQALLDKLCALVTKLRPGIDLGPMTSLKQKEAVRAQINACVRAGARIAARSEGDFEGESLSMPAMVLDGCAPGMPVWDEEIFGPVTAVIPASGDEEALALANSSPYGLSASVWSRNRAAAGRLAARVRAGAVMINDHLMSHGLPETPWGGFGYSGLGRTHGEAGFMEMLRGQAVVDDILPAVKRNIFWHPYSDQVYAGLRALTQLLAGGMGGRLAALPRVIRIFLRYWSAG